MWLTRQLKQDAGTKITGGQTMGGSRFSVRGETDHPAPELLFPYGFSSLAAQGQQAVMLGDLCAGVSGLPDSALEEGEVRLYSAGGAEILLKRNGQVVINGQVFGAKTT